MGWQEGPLAGRQGSGLASAPGSQAEAAQSQLRPERVRLAGNQRSRPGAGGEALRRPGPKTRRARKVRGPGSLGALIPIRGLGWRQRPGGCFYFLSDEITPTDSPEAVCGGGSWEGEKVDF